MFFENIYIFLKNIAWLLSLQEFCKILKTKYNRTYMYIICICTVGSQGFKSTITWRGCFAPEKKNANDVHMVHIIPSSGRQRVTKLYNLQSHARNSEQGDCNMKTWFAQIILLEYGPRRRWFGGCGPTDSERTRWSRVGGWEVSWSLMLHSRGFRTPSASGIYESRL